jgi:hypothetical protein
VQATAGCDRGDQSSQPGSLVVVGITSLVGAIIACLSDRVLLTRVLAFGAVAHRRRGGRESIRPGHQASAAGRVRLTAARGRRSDGRPPAPIPARAAKSTHLECTGGSDLAAALGH